jgi:hypothetical protein
VTEDGEPLLRQWPPHHVLLEWDWGVPYALWNADPPPPIERTGGGHWSGYAPPGFNPESVDPLAALLSEELRAELKRWTTDAPAVMELIDGMDEGRDISSEEQAVIAEHYSRKRALAQRVKAELGSNTVVSWVDDQGIERTVDT